MTRKHGMQGVGEWAEGSKEMRVRYGVDADEIADWLAIDNGLDCPRATWNPWRDMPVLGPSADTQRATSEPAPATSVALTFFEEFLERMISRRHMDGGERWQGGDGRHTEIC